MKPGDRLIEIILMIAIAIMCIQFGIGIGGEMERNRQVEKITVKQADKLQNDVVLTIEFLDMVNTVCKEDKQDIINDMLHWKNKAETSNDDGNCSLCGFQ